MPGALVSFLRRNWFLLGMLVAIALGLLVPEAGRRLNPGSVTRLLLIAVLFLIAGFTLPSESIGAGLASWRLHLFVQGFLFLLTPALFFLSSLPLRGLFGPELSAGVLALSVLPTTIASCIVFTQVSGGNVMGTLFNAALANLAGLFLSPLLLALLLRGAGRSLPAGELAAVLRDLGLQILLPLGAGQLLRLFLKPLAERGRGALAQVSNALLLGVIFLTMAASAGDPAFLGRLAWAPWPFAYLAVMHLLVVALAYGGARALRFPRADVISATFAAPQKTLAMGVPLLCAYFARDPQALGLVLLPILLYHPWQLLVAGFLRNAFLSHRDLRADTRSSGPPRR
jgi:solute carrier family 10 (sodium/bile acid cotransporter), member 7